MLILDKVNGLGIIGTTNTRYQIQSNASPTGGTWVPVLHQQFDFSGIQFDHEQARPGILPRGVAN